MSNLDWSKIGNGTTFESLVATLIRHEDQRAIVYDRSGKDAGIDSKSSDGKTVYQAKFIKDESFSVAIVKAKQEIAKIKEYRKEEHSNFSFWKDVVNWTLVTNATINPADEKRWEDEVVPLFKAEGFSEIKFWNSGVLVEKLTKYTSIRRSFFEGENRVLLSLGEGFEQVDLQDFVVSRGLDASYVGRQEELSGIDSFLNDDMLRILPVHGAGGVGKTRFSIEAGYRSNRLGWDVYWANPSTLERSSTWFQDIISERKTLLIIDEPQSEQTIKILLEQISSSKLRNWKAIIVTRSAKDHLFSALKKSRSKIVAKDLSLQEMAAEEMETMAFSLLRNSSGLREKSDEVLKDWSKKISKAVGGYPIWTSVAVLLVESRKSIDQLPADEYGIADGYLQEIIKNPPVQLDQHKFSEFINYFALFQPVNVSEPQKELFSILSRKFNLNNDSETLAVFENLEKRRLARRRVRFAEIKPDVIRDYIIFERIGGNEQRSKELVDEVLSINDLEIIKKVLRQLGRIDLSGRINEGKSSILNKVWSQLIDIVKTGTLVQQYNIFDIASSFSFSNTSQFISLCKAIWDNSKEDQDVQDKIWGKHTLSHKDLILKLSWGIFSAARYATSEDEAQDILDALINLASYEQKNIGRDNQYLMNDGKRALPLIVRLVGGEKGQFFNFESIIYKWVYNSFENLQSFPVENQEMLNTLAKAILSLERESIHSKGNQIVISTGLVNSKSKIQEKRLELKKKIRDCLEPNGGVSIELRKIIWKILQESHRQVNIASDSREQRKRDKEEIDYWENELKADLEKLKTFLTSYKPAIDEIEHIRAIWDWNIRFDKREDIKSLAQECESLISIDTTVDIFKRLFSYDTIEGRDELAVQVIQAFQSENDIVEFVEKANKFSGKDKFWYGVGLIAHHLGNKGEEYAFIEEYLKSVLAARYDKHHYSFACEIISTRTKFSRQSGSEVHLNLLNTYWRLASTRLLKNTLLYQLYWQPHPASRGLLIKEDLDFISSIVDARDYDDESIFILASVLGYIFYINLPRSMELANRLLKEVDTTKKVNVYKNIVDGVWYRSIFSDRDYPVEFPEDIFHWIISLLNLIPDIDKVSGLFEHEIIELKKKTRASFDVGQFSKFLHERVSIYDKLSELDKEKWKLTTLQNVLTRIVDKVPPSPRDRETLKKDFMSLLALNSHKSYLGYSLPEIVNKIDPNGEIVPEVVIEKINNREFVWEETKDDSIVPFGYEWMRYAGYYPTNSQPWRKIAIHSCSLIKSESQEIKKKVYSSLMDHSIKTYWGTPGEVSGRYYSDLEQAQQDLDSESDPNLKDFFMWRLNVAKADLEREKKVIEEGEDD